MVLVWKKKECSDSIKFLHSKQPHQSKPRYWVIRSLLRPLVITGTYTCMLDFHWAKFGGYIWAVALCISADTNLWRSANNRKMHLREQLNLTIVHSMDSVACTYQREHEQSRRWPTQQILVVPSQRCQLFRRKDQAIVMSYQLWMASDQGLLFIDHH